MFHMAEIVTLKSGHPLVGTWRDADEELGTNVQFTIRAAGSTFEVAGVDTSNGVMLSISNVRWDGRILSFDSTVQSTGHHVWVRIRGHFAVRGTGLLYDVRTMGSSRHDRLTGRCTCRHRAALSRAPRARCYRDSRVPQ
jgi:hypothetical protein